MNTLKDIITRGSQTSDDLWSVLNFINSIVNLALDFAFIISVIMVLYSAFLYVTSGGESTKAETAKKILLWAVVGIILLFLAKTIVGLVQTQVQVRPQ